MTLDGAAYFNIGNSTVNDPAVRTSGAQTYNGPVQLQTDTVLASTAGGMVGTLAAGNITFNSTVDGTYLLEVDTAGVQAFNGVVGGRIA